jgi:hypothetical protein
MTHELDDDYVIEPPLRKPTVCLRCGYPMTWENQRRQFGRLMRRGMTTEETKALLPRCQKCMTTALRDAAMSGR